MSSYRAIILEDTGCAADDAGLIEHIMREDVFHSTLDWQTRAELCRAARRAAKMLDENRDLYERGQAQTRAIFEGMRAAAGSKAGA